MGGCGLLRQKRMDRASHLGSIFEILFARSIPFSASSSPPRVHPPPGV